MFDVQFFLAFRQEGGILQLLNPIMLLALGFIPVLILIHTLRPKPRPLTVTNLFLWQELLKERSRHVTLKRLRKNLPLLLQILMILLVALALARPVWLHLVSKRGDIVLVLDTSASMQTRTPFGTRFDQARERALDTIDGRHSPQRVLMVEAAATPRLVSGWTSSSQQARDLVQGMSASDVAGDLEEALVLALSFVDPGRDDSVYLITDGAGGNLSALLERHPQVVPLVVTGGESNVGITRFEMRPQPDVAHGYEIMLEIKSFIPAPITCPLHLTMDSDTLLDAPVTFEPLEKKRLIISHPGPVSGIVRAELTIDDDLAVDNRAALALEASQDIWVLLLSKGNYFLEKLLKAYPRVMVNSMTDIVASSWRQQVQRHDLVIVDRMDFPDAERGNFLLIDAFSTALPFRKNGRIDHPAVLDWDRKHPLMAHVNLEGLIIAAASRVGVAEAAEAVVESSDTLLMGTYAEAGLRAVWLGFDINASDLPLRVAFPVMMGNIIDWLIPHKLNFSVQQAAPGEPLDIYLSPQTTTVSIRAPKAKWERIDVRANPLRYLNTDKVGVYTLSEKGRQRSFTVNLVNESESDIRAPDPDDLSGLPGKTALEATAAQQPLQAWLLVAVLTLLMCEWYVWLKWT